MKYSLLLLLTLFSTTVFAIGTNEITGTFEVDQKITGVESDARYLTGATYAADADNTRIPASTDDSKKISHVTELTGTFE